MDFEGKCIAVILMRRWLDKMSFYHVTLC